MGMLSNPHFRVKMFPKANNEGRLVLHCEHPTKSGGEPGGWMEREAMEGGGMQQVMDKQSVASTNVDTSKLKTYTVEQVGDPCQQRTLYALLLTLQEESVDSIRQLKGQGPARHGMTAHGWLV